MIRLIEPKRILRIAKLLCSEVGLAESEQESLRFAVICAYYAVFHSLCKMCANAFAGDSALNSGSERGWIEVYRFLGHTATNEACKRIKTRFNSVGILSFAYSFTILQQARELANYTPEGEADASEVFSLIEFAEEGIEIIENLSAEEKVDFAIFLMMKGKGVNDARERWRKNRINQLFEGLNLTKDRSADK